MKTFKLISGILCFVLACLVMFQSCAAGIVNTLGETGEVSGSAGLILALGMIAGGIIQIATRKSEKKGGSIAAIVVFGLAGIIGFACAGSFADLNIWAGFCILLALINIVSLFIRKKSNSDSSVE